MTINAGSSGSFSAVFAPTSAGAATGSISVVSNAPGASSNRSIGNRHSGPTRRQSGEREFRIGQCWQQRISDRYLDELRKRQPDDFASDCLGHRLQREWNHHAADARCRPKHHVQRQVRADNRGKCERKCLDRQQLVRFRLTIGFSGTATQPQITATPASATFGRCNRGTSNSQTINLTNGGTASLTISSVTVAGTGLNMTGITAPLIIGAGNATTFNAMFAPTTAGTVSGSVTMTSNAPISPRHRAERNRRGFNEAVGAQHFELELRPCQCRKQRPLSAVLTNNGNSNVTISSVGSSGAGFSASGVTASEVLTPNQSATVTVEFAPNCRSDNRKHQHRE